MARLNYTTINHEARVRLGLAINEYCVYDLIHNLASNPKNTQMGWCYARKETLANYLDLSRATVFRAIKKGLKIGILEKHPDQPAFLKATSYWYDSVMIKTESQNDTASLKVRHYPSQNETESRIKLRTNKDIENNENDNKDSVNLKESSNGVSSIADVITNHKPSLLNADTEWEVEAIRLWGQLGLSGDPSHSFVKHIHRYFKKNLQSKLFIALSYCKDATNVRNKEKLFYWRCANEPT